MVIKRYKAEKQPALQVFNAIKNNDFLLHCNTHITTLQLLGNASNYIL
jgi:hypothetical protein